MTQQPDSDQEIPYCRGFSNSS